MIPKKHFVRNEKQEGEVGKEEKTRLEDIGEQRDPWVLKQE